MAVETNIYYEDLLQLVGLIETIEELGTRSQVTIRKAGKPIAVLISAKQYETLRTKADQYDAKVHQEKKDKQRRSRSLS